MANRHVSHIKSNQTVTLTENGVTTVSPKLPTSQQILYGEIAINYAKGHEKLAIKNSNDEIVTFPTDQQFERVEKVISAALNELDGRVVELNTEITSIETQKIDNVLWDTDSTTGQVTLRLRHNNGDSTYTNVASVQIPFADNSGNTGVIDGTGSGLSLNYGVIGLDIQTPLYITQDEELSVQNASTSDWGVVKIGSGINVSNGVISVASASNLSLGQGYAICNTQASTAAKTVSLTGYMLEDGGIVSIKFIYDVPASSTLNINNKGACSIYYRGTAITDDVIKAGDIATMMYYSGNYYLIGNDRWDESKINSISVNGTAQTITNKNVDLDVPKSKTFDVAMSGDMASPTLNFGTITFSDIEDAFENYDQVYINLKDNGETVIMCLRGYEKFSDQNSSAYFFKGMFSLLNNSVVTLLILEDSVTPDSIDYDLETIPLSVQSDWNEQDTNSPAFIDNKPTIGDATLSIQKNGTTIDTFSANSTTNKTVNITVPVSSDYLGSFDLSIDSSTYVMTLQGKDGAGNNKGTAQTIDLPLETMVVNGSYDSTNQKIVLTLKNGTTVDIPIGALINGLQEEITSTNKLSADLVEDGNTNKVYTATEKTKLSGIAAGAEVNVQSNWNESDTTSDAYIQNKPTVGNATITIQKNGTNVDSFALNSTTAKTINIANVQDTLSASNKLNADYIQDGINNKVFTAEDEEILDGIDDRFDALIANDEKIEKVTASALNDLDFRINNIATNTVDGISYENVSASGGKVSITHTDSGTTTTVDEALIPIVSTGTNAVNGLMTPTMLENIDTISETLEDLESIVEEGQEVTANSLVELDGRLTSAESTITSLEQTVDDNELVTSNALSGLDGRLTSAESTITSLEQTVDDNELVTATALNELNDNISDINSSVSGLRSSISGINTSISTMSDAIDDIEEEIDNLSLMEEVTYSQIVALKNGGNLVPGMKYRITDYTTSIKSEYSSMVSFAGHHFDIVVTALSNNELSENASAAHHSGDTYFANSNLSAWQLKYTTDNTFNIFSTFNQQVTDSLWDAENSKGIVYYMKDEWSNECIYDFKNLMFTMNDKTAYTFTYAVTEGGTTTYSDCTVDSTTKASFNIIKGIMVAFINTGNGTSNFNIVENTILTSFGSNCNNNKICNTSLSTFGDNCRHLDLYNAWGFNCGNMCTYITGSPDECSLGNNCSDIKFGTNSRIEFGDNCHNISIASGNVSIKTVDPSDSDVIIGRFSNIDIKENNDYILLTTTETLGDLDYIRNLTLDRGLNTNSSEWITISHNSKNDNFNTTYQKANSRTVNIA